VHIKTDKLTNQTNKSGPAAAKNGALQ